MKKTTSKLWILCNGHAYTFGISEQNHWKRRERKRRMMWKREMAKLTKIIVCVISFYANSPASLAAFRETVLNCFCGFLSPSFFKCRFYFVEYKKCSQRTVSNENKSLLLLLFLSLLLHILYISG